MSTDFTAGTDSINAQNLGFTGVQPAYVAGNALNAATKPVLTFDNAASATVVGPGAAGTAGLRGTPKKFASAANGAGTVDVVGTMTLNAPTSTPAGTYKATVTFTVL
ncbi:hypothetical protein GCM10025868_19430 [Angustibacter aerolatus]|uniref:WxL domain-containing protein n=1 Tax=Angustibacter aerolatus TaxID=1162965 RepID=A0ABQ6JES4_9ACTN|nr:hypothetical protein [Angustibacter aerolatus]GMA86693.1 hypothetical protein GCM10025868_19430 [Angustibacter aerolatus]